MIDKFKKEFIALSKSEAQPLHQQIHHRLKQAIESNLLKDGDRVPSTRALAAELNLSRGTIESAYAILLGEGILISKGQAGTFVNAPYAFDKKITGATTINPASKNVTPSPTRPLDFVNCSHIYLPGSPAYDAFPKKIWSRLSSNRVRHLSANHMSYQDPLGYFPLRESIATYLRLSRGVVCDPKQIFITAGYQGALDFVTKALKLYDEEVWIEDPGYLFATKLLVNNGIKVTRVPVDQEGLIVADGIEKSPDAKLAIVTPSHHSPLGMAMSWSRRLQLLEWAIHNNSWIIEDDYDGEFRYSGYPMPSLKSLDQYDRVIYAGTFSKTIFPSLRLGYLVLPHNLVDICTEQANNFRIGNSLASQLVVNDFIAEGHFSKHLNKMRTLYAHRRELTTQSLTNIFGQAIDVNSHQNGVHFVAKIAPNYSDKTVATAFNELGHGIGALSNWTTDPSQNGLIIGFTNVPNKKTADDAAIKLRGCFV